MSRDGCGTLPRGAMGLSEVLIVIVVFPDHIHLLFCFMLNLNILASLSSSVS